MASYPIIQDRMSYAIICGDIHEARIIERDLADIDRATTVKDIADGYYDDVLQVVEFNPVEHICRDVTEDIAWEVSAIWAHDGERLTGWRLEFIEMICGLDAANAFREVA